MSLIPFFPKLDRPWSPPDDDSALQSRIGARLKTRSKLYRELLESMVRELDARGNIQCFAFTLNVLPGSKAPVGTMLVAVEPDNQLLVHGHSFELYVDYILSDLAGVDLLECIFITQEFHREGELKGLPHYHVFLALRSLFGTEGVYIQAALQSSLVKSFPDFQLRRLNTFLDQKRYLNYMVKEEKLYYHALYVFSSMPKKDMDSYYHSLARQESMVQELEFAIIAAYRDLPTRGEFSRIYRDQWGQPLYLPYPYQRARSDFQALHRRHEDIDPPPGEGITVDTLLYCLHLYCHFSGYFLCRESLYRRSEKTRYSWELVFTLETLLEDLLPVYSFLAKEFPFQFKHARNYVKQAFVRHVPEIMARVRKSTTGLLPMVQLNYHLVEFRNGIYNKRIGQFLDYSKYKENELSGLQFNCYLYFDRYFKSSSRMIPHTWLKLLRPQFQSDSELDEFCARFAVLFHGDSIQEKALEPQKQDKALYVEGVSNSGKTRLLADVVRAIVGPENTGLLGSSEQFPLETARDKQALVLDEYRFRPSQRDILLRLLDGTPLPLDKKHQAQQIVSIIAPVLILANMDRNQAMLSDEAFRNRLRHYRFNLVVSETPTKFLEAVQEELPRILLYCNRLFLKSYGSAFPEIRDLYQYRYSRKPLQRRLLAQGFLLPPSDPVEPL